MDEAKWIGERRVLERDYTPRLKQLDTELTPEERARLLLELEKQKKLKALPCAVDERAAAEFDYMVIACGKVMKAFAGRLRAVVDHRTHDASIVMECDYVEFMAGEFMDVLLAIAIKALHISFEPTTSDFLKITITMPYFRLPR